MPTETRRAAAEPDVIANRKLIRPSLSDIREQIAKAKIAPAPAPMPPAPASAPAPPAAAFIKPVRKPIPPEQTNAENFYYLKQMQTRIPIVAVLLDGEHIEGVLEWYDRHCLKINRTGQPNLLVYKSQIKYLYKTEEADK